MAAPIILGGIILAGLGAYAVYRERKNKPVTPPVVPPPVVPPPVVPPPAAPPGPQPQVNPAPVPHINTNPGVVSGPARTPSSFKDSDPVAHSLKNAWNAGFVDNVTWVPVQLGPFTLEVAAEPLAVQGVRVPTDMNDAIDVLRTMNAILPTKEIADAIWGAASRKVTPSPLPADATMGTWGATRTWNGKLGAPGDQLAAGGWKHWIVANPMGAMGAVNYGLWKPDGSVWQQPGRQHDPNYLDYSQLLQPVRVAAKAGDRPIDLIDWLSTTHQADEVPGATGRELGGPIAATVLNRFRNTGA